MLHSHYHLFTTWLHIHPHWAGIVIFFVTLAESIALIGSIVPGAVVMTAIGILVGSGVLPIWSMLIFAIAGAIIGDGLSYYLGYHFKDNLITIWPFSHHPKIFLTGEKFFLKHGGKSVFIGRFFGPVRAIVPIIAGMLNMRPKRYFAASIPSAITWAPTYMLPGILLGAASLEMSKDMATELIIAVLVILIGLWLLAKLITLLYRKTHLYFAKQLDQKWQIWCTRSSTRWLCILLHHAGRPQKRGQLLLAVNLVVAAILFLFIFANVVFHGPLIGLNQMVYHLLRGFRTPTLDQVMQVITTFGYKDIVLILVVVLFGWLCLKRKWLTAFHWLIGCGLAFGAVYFFKHIYFSPRPTGIFKQASSSSFPSGHTTLSTAIYGLLAYFIAIGTPKHLRKIIGWCAVILCLSIGFSRLYLEAHWLTDVLGGFLVGLSCISLTIISYRRHQADKLSPLPILLIAIVTLAIAVSVDLSLYFKTAVRNSQAVWPTRTVTKLEWWNQTSDKIPLYRTNRLGIPTQLLNIQWAGSLINIKQTLKQHGWHNPHTRDYIATLKTVAEQNIVKNQSLLAPLFNDQHPVLVAVKFVSNQSPPLMLTLWQSDVTVFPNNTPLWVGTIYYDASHKHLFTFHHHLKPVYIRVAANALIPALKQFTWHMKIVQTNTLPKQLIKKQILDRVILIKPKEL